MPSQPSRTEFIALMAMLSATVAFSIDAMLPALPTMAEALTPQAPNRAQFVITSFLLGMGVGTLFTGPLSDSFGRKAVMLSGAGLYILGALVAAQAQSLEVLVAARLMQGLGAAGPRVVALAVIRDLYAGRGMARIMSFVMLVFTLVPAIAPLAGAYIIRVADWHGVFYAFVIFAMISALWVVLRLPETLPVTARRPFRLPALRAALVEVFANPVVRLAIAVQSLCYAILFTMISTIQPIFDQSLGAGDSFPVWFSAIAVVAASASVVNAALVGRLGMRRMVTLMMLVEMVLSALMACLLLSGLSGGALFAATIVWITSLFFMAGMTIGNLNAIAMEPMGHIAGMAASVIGAVATVAAVMLTAPIGLAFDGTALPMTLGIFAECAVAVFLMRRMTRISGQAA